VRVLLESLARKLLFEFAQVFFIRETFAKIGHYYESLSLCGLQLVKGYQLLPPGPPGGPAREWYRTFAFPFIGSNQASEGEASPQPNNMVLRQILAPAAGTDNVAF